MLFLVATLLLPSALLDRFGLLVAFLLLRLKNFEVVVETIESLFPEATIFLEPVIGLFQRFCIDAARTHLSVARACDQARTLENLQVLGDRRQADIERFGEFQHRGLAEREARKDRAPRRIGEGCEGRAQTVAHLIKPCS